MGEQPPERPDGQMPVFADDGATVTIRNSMLQSDGGTLSSEYLNTPSQGLMVAPPWILGIMGTSRCSNMMGNDTTTNEIDSETSVGVWAVLSTDAGQDMYLNIYNTSLTLNNADESKYQIQEEGGQISISLAGNAVWNVTGTSLISDLSVEDEAQVVIPEGVTLTVNGTEYSGCILTEEDF